MSDDLKIIRHVIAGDANAFRALVKRYERPLFCLIRNLNVPDVEDLAQDVFLSAYANLRSFDHRKASFATWLFTIARNKCWNALKKKSPQLQPYVHDQIDLRNPEKEIEEQEFYRLLDTALVTLPLEQRSAFVLAEIQGRALQEVSRIENVKLGTLKSRISRAKEKLRVFFRDAVKQP